MYNENHSVTFRVTGDFALFSAPESPRNAVGAECHSYPVPTQEALRGIVEAIYWVPTLKWHVHRVRVVNPIQYGSYGVCFPGKEGYDIFHWMVLQNVCYEVEAWFEWNHERPDLRKDRIAAKHLARFKSALAHGGRRDVYLGSRSFQGYVEPCEFGKAPGAFDEAGCEDMGMMFHSFDYDDSSAVMKHGKALNERFAPVQMENGIITFVDAEKCPVVREIKRGTQNESAE